MFEKYIRRIVRAEVKKINSEKELNSLEGKTEYKGLYIPEIHGVDLSFGYANTDVK